MLWDLKILYINEILKYYLMFKVPANKVILSAVALYGKELIFDCKLRKRYNQCISLLYLSFRTINPRTSAYCLFSVLY